MKILTKLPNPQGFRRLPQKRSDQWLWGDRSLIYENLEGEPTSLFRIVSTIEDPFALDEVVVLISPQKGKSTSAKVVTRIDFKVFPPSGELAIPAVLEREIFPGRFGYSKAPCIWFADFEATGSDDSKLRVLYSFYPKNWSEALRFFG